MAWIKMRMDLQRHPKVVRMASALRADIFRVIGGLHAVWSVFDEHSLDGTLDGYTLEAMDGVIGWPGFCAAMARIEWLHEHDGSSLFMPEFDEHNGQSAKRRATDAKRKRDKEHDGSDEAIDESVKPPKKIRKVSASNADEKRTRERERRRVEKEGIEPSGSIPPYPPGLDVEAWEKFASYRASIGKPIKPASLAAAQQVLADFSAEQQAVVAQSIANGWQGLFAIKQAQAAGHAPPPLNRQEAIEHSNRAVADRWLAKQGTVDA